MVAVSESIGFLRCLLANLNTSRPSLPSGICKTAGNLLKTWRTNFLVRPPAALHSVENHGWISPPGMVSPAGQDLCAYT
jgi:hypothetical protein